MCVQTGGDGSGDVCVQTGGGGSGGVTDKPVTCWIQRADPLRRAAVEPPRAAVTPRVTPLLLAWWSLRQLHLKSALKQLNLN